MSNTPNPVTHLHRPPPFPRAHRGSRIAEHALSGADAAGQRGPRVAAPEERGGAGGLQWGLQAGGLQAWGLRWHAMDSKPPLQLGGGGGGRGGLGLNGIYNQRCCATDNLCV